MNKYVSGGEHDPRLWGQVDLTLKLLLLVMIAGGVSKACAEEAEKGWEPAKAVSYFLKHQAEDGQWESAFQPTPDRGNVSTTALGAQALLLYREVDAKGVIAAVEKALAYLTTDRRLKSRPYLNSSWAHGYTLELLAALVSHPGWKDRQKELKAKAAEFATALGRVQGRTGGWGYGGSFQAAGALVALQAAQRAAIQVDQETLSKGIQFLQALRTPDRGYVYIPRSRRSHKRKKVPRALERSVGRLGVGELALFQAGLVQPMALTNTMGHFMDHRDYLWKTREWVKMNKQPTTEAGTPYAAFAFFGYLYTAKALVHALGPQRKEWAAILKADLMKVQDPDGLWTSVESRSHRPPASKLYGTANAMIALKYFEEILE